MVSPARLEDTAPNAKKAPLLSPPPRAPHPVRAQTQRKERLILLLVALPLLLGGTGFYLYAMGPRKQANFLKTYGESAQAQVLEVSRVSVNGKPAGAIVSYAFAVGEQRHEGRADIRGHDQTELWEGFVPGGEGAVRYSPHDHANHMLAAAIEDVLADFQWGYVGWIGVALAMVLIGMVIWGAVSGDKAYTEGIELFAEVVELKVVEDIPKAVLAWEASGERRTATLDARRASNPAYVVVRGYEPHCDAKTELAVGDRVAMLAGPEENDWVVITPTLLEGC